MSGANLGITKTKNMLSSTKTVRRLEVGKPARVRLSPVKLTYVTQADNSTYASYADHTPVLYADGTEVTYA